MFAVSVCHTEGMSTGLLTSECFHVPRMEVFCSLSHSKCGLMGKPS